MLNGCPVIRNLSIGLGIGSLIALQFKMTGSVKNLIQNYLFTNANHLVEGLILLCQMSSVERLIGSSVLLTRLIFTAGLSIFLNLFFTLNLELPQILIFSFFPIYLEKQPALRKMCLGAKLTISEKVLTYGLIAICAKFNPKSAGFGICVGIVMKKWNQSLIIINNEPDDVIDPIGATVEIQRKIKMDEAEERFTRQQMQRHLMQQQIRRRQHLQPPQHVAPPPPYAPSDDEVGSLVSMGFREPEVRRALVATNGNLTAAAEKLINREV